MNSGPPRPHAPDRGGQAPHDRNVGLLDTRPGLRRLGAVLWSSFLGASLSMAVLALIPEDFALPPHTPGGATLIFICLWALALVPAIFASVLAVAPSRGRDNAP